MDNLDELWQVMAKISYNAHDASEALRHLCNSLARASTSGTTEIPNQNSDFDFPEQDVYNKINDFLKADCNGQLIPLDNDKNL